MNGLQKKNSAEEGGGGDAPNKNVKTGVERIEDGKRKKSRTECAQCKRVLN